MIFDLAAIGAGKIATLLPINHVAIIQPNSIDRTRPIAHQQDYPAIPDNAVTTQCPPRPGEDTGHRQRPIGGKFTAQQEAIQRNVAVEDHPSTPQADGAAAVQSGENCLPATMNHGGAIGIGNDNTGPGNRHLIPFPIAGIMPGDAITAAIPTDQPDAKLPAIGAAL